MQIELFIDGEKKLFTAPFVPMLAKRKYLELKAAEDASTWAEVIEEDDAYLSILADVVFQGQFTVMDVYAGASGEYVRKKLDEAVFGVKREAESNEGNQPGE
ncbi:phage tail assembly chaperone G [Sporosarcina highlanderae]|uniref:Phage protein n=1 Tax=Sporosarcina highlanderae TaxID=3035916 RepID=A0ABT8JX28_9BACL|nr:hypothetical protein [Sporosarcina highlanderae]MDN4609121.1 hypothetical protein [Sporosarcina highlanderae]